MQMEFNGKLHSAKSTDNATGLSASVQINCSIFDGSVDVVELFKYHPAGRLSLKAYAGDKAVGGLNGARIRGTRTTTTKEGTFIYVNFQSKPDKDYLKLETMLSEVLRFELTMNADEEAQPELAEE